MAALLLGVIVGILINLVTALFSRKHALQMIPWLCLYIAVHGLTVLLNSEPVRIEAMAIARKSSPWASYPIVILVFSALGCLYWWSINAAVNRLDKATTTPASQPPAPPAVPVAQPANKTRSVPPITKSLRFTAVIPLTDASQSVPVPMNTNNEDPKADFYQDLLGMTARPDQPPPGVTYKERKLDSPGDKFLFVTRLMQYYVLHSLRVLQGGRKGTKWTAGKGVTAIDVMPIIAPDATPYPTDALIHALVDSEFFNPGDRMFWTARPFQLPHGTNISLAERQPKDSPFECFVRLERSGYYRIDFVTSPSIAIQGQPPAGFQTPTPSVNSYPVTVTMNYEVQRRGDGFEPDIYARWADSLFSGLKDIMAP
jgi:hypothetical protein